MRSRDELIAALRDPGFTPGRRDVLGLVGLLDDAELAPRVEAALASLGDALLPLLAAPMNAHALGARARLVRAVGKAHRGAAEQAWMIRALADHDLRVRREAVVQLGKFEVAPASDASSAADAVARALLDAFERTLPELERVERDAAFAAWVRSLVEALGKRATPAVQRVLLERQREILAYPTLVQVFERATLRAVRDVQRETQPARGIDAEVPVSAEVWLTCRKGLEVLLADELGAWGGRVKAPGVVSASLDGTPRASLAALFAARLWLELAFPLPQPAIGDEADAVVAAMHSDAARALIHTLSRGAPTYRIAWDDGRHRRAETYALVQRLRDVLPDLLNDPRGSTWEIRVRSGRTPAVLLVPQSLQDTRFSYRRGDVPAASHPTLAAALALVARPSSTDVIWDPFVGSGTELRECAMRGPYARLCGSDHDESALRTAAANLEGLSGVTLRVADCLDTPPRGVTLIISNPPMGRRVERHQGLLPMLEAFLQHAYDHLPRGGRLVWLAPSPGRLRPAGVRVGFELTYARAVDMGGFEVELQAWRKPY